jgi:hypothetical protein
MAPTIKAFLADCDKPVNITERVCKAYTYFKNAATSNDFTIGGEAGFPLTKQELGVLKRDRFVDPKEGAKVCPVKGLNSGEQAGRLLAKADRLMPTAEVLDAVMKATARTALVRQSYQEEHPWLINLEAEEVKDLLVVSPGRLVVTASIGSGREEHYTFAAGPAITQNGTRHPYVWQVLHQLPGSRRGVKLTGLVCWADGSFTFMPASHEGFAAFVEAHLSGDGLWATTDVEILWPYRDGITSFSAALTQHALGGRDRVLTSDALCMVLGPAPRTKGRGGERTKSTALEKADERVQQAFAAAFASKQPLGVAIGKISGREDLRLGGVFKDFKITSNVKGPMVRASRCWVCSRPLSKKGALLGRSCHDDLMRLLDSLGLQHLHGLAQTDPAALFSEINQDHSEEELRGIMEELRKMKEQNGGESEEDAVVDSEDERFLCDDEEEEEPSDDSSEEEEDWASDSASDDSSDSDSEEAPRPRKKSRR